MQNRMTRWIAISMSSLLLLAGTFVRAEEGMSQGEAAVVLAQRLGLSASNTKPLSPTEAVRLLMENQITPFGGWQLDQPLLVKDLARVLVQALGAADQIPADQRDNADTTAYVDYLTREYNLDMSSIAEALSQLGGAPNPQGSGLLGDATSSDPLENSGAGGEPDETFGGSPGNLNLPVNLVTLQEVLFTAVPSTGGGGGGGDTNDQPTTQNVPTPAP